MRKADLIIFSGQSNMQGQSEALLPVSLPDDVYEYRYLTDSLIPLADPVGESIRYDGEPGEDVTVGTDVPRWLSEHVTGSSCYGHTSLVPAFLSSFRALTQRPAVAVHIAKGSTVIADWLPGTPGFTILVTKAAAALRAVGKRYGVGRVFFVWLQGESDAIFGTDAEIYGKRLRLLGNALRESLGIRAFGIIRVGHFTFDARDDAIMEAQSLAAADPDEPPFFVMLTEKAAELIRDPRCVNPFVPGHFGAHGLQVLGTLAGTALGEYALREEQNSRN